MIRGLDTPEHLWRWLRARGHRNLVLRVADILGMPAVHQEHLAGLLGPFPSGQTLRSWYQQQGINGYIVRPWSDFEGLDMAKLEELQHLLRVYYDARFLKGEPSRTEACDCNRSPRCPMCEGSGHVHVLIEMSDEETTLARG